MSSLWLFGRPYYGVPRFCGPFVDGHEFGLMFDGDDMCLKLWESGGRKNLDTVLAD